jgi:hypothetical protein
MLYAGNTYFLNKTIGLKKCPEMSDGRVFSGIIGGNRKAASSSSANVN